MATLTDDLHNANQILDIEKILEQKLSKRDVERYYQYTNFFYRKFHSQEGAMHFPLYLDGRAKHHQAGLYEQANLIEPFIPKSTKTKILELGSGQGFNTLALAHRFPAMQFVGIDLSATHILQAQKKAPYLVNVSFLQGDFNGLVFENSTFDVVFAVESFCYAAQTEEIYQKIYSILRPNGYWIVFDVFLQPNFADLSPDLKKASTLSALGFAVQDWKPIGDFRAKATQVGFEVVQTQDISEAILPNLKAFEKGARKIFRKPWLTKFLLKTGILPRSLYLHALSGLMGIHTLGKAQGYYWVVLKK